jgi:hypothetical protein
VVMEAIIRNYYCFPLHYFGWSPNLHVFMVLLVMESRRSYWDSAWQSWWIRTQVPIPCCYLCYAGCTSNSVSGTALSTASSARQVAGNSTDSLHIVLWLVVLSIR